MTVFEKYMIKCCVWCCYVQLCFVWLCYGALTTRLSLFDKARRFVSSLPRGAAGERIFFRASHSLFVSR